MRWLILPSLLCSIALAFAQDAQESQPGRIPYLLRLERLRSYRDVCVLLRNDGQYHLEILDPDHTRVLEGALSTAALSELRQMTSSEKLAQLQQRDIRTPLVESERDEFLLSILRLGRWQNLRFADGEIETRRTILPLVIAVGVEQTGVNVVVAGERFARRICVGRFAVIDEAYAADVGDQLLAMREAGDIEHGHAFLLQMRRHAKQRADCHNTRAANAGDQNAVWPVDQR